MKHLLVLTFLLCSFQAAQSQILIALIFGDKLNSETIEFGMNVGANYAGFSSYDASHYREGLNLGLYFNFLLNDRFILNPSLYFSYPSGIRDIEYYQSPDPNLNELIIEAQANRKLSYFSLPVVIRYKLFGKTYLDFGPQFGLTRRVEDQFVVSVQDKNDLTYTVNIKEDYHRLDAGITAGFSQRLRDKNSVILSARYYYGLVNIAKNPADGNIHNSVVYFSCGIPVGGNNKGVNDKL